MNQDRPIWEKLALIGSNRRLSLFTLWSMSINKKYNSFLANIDDTCN